MNREMELKKKNYIVLLVGLVTYIFLFRLRRI